jgi:hypothetical protein
MSQVARPLLLDDSRAFFGDCVDGALKRTRFQPLPLARNYLIDLLQHFMFSSNLFQKQDTLAELFLRAQNSPAPQRVEMLKKLGDGSLYISGFFGDSLARKIVDIDYYVDMGGTAYGSLAAHMADENMAQVYHQFSARFAEFVDVLTYISQESLIQTNGDLLKLYSRYMATGSRLAEEQLVEKGLLSADLQKTKANKM